MQTTTTTAAKIVTLNSVSRWATSTTCACCGRKVKKPTGIFARSASYDIGHAEYPHGANFFVSPEHTGADEYHLIPIGPECAKRFG